MYTLLLLLIYMAFISLGLPDSLLGSAWPIMHEAFSVPLSYAGLVTMIISAGTICSSLMSERLTKKFGTQIVTVCSVLLTAAALFGFFDVERIFTCCACGRFRMDLAQELSMWHSITMLHCIIHQNI